MEELDGTSLQRSTLRLQLSVFDIVNCSCSFFFFFFPRRSHHLSSITNVFIVAGEIVSAPQRNRLSALCRFLFLCIVLFSYIFFLLLIQYNI